MGKDFLIKNLIFKKRIELISQKKKMYNNTVSKEFIYQYQLKLFNEQWKNIIKNNSFYKYWKNIHSLPKQINSLEQILEFPKLTKRIIQDNQELIFDNVQNYKVINTGGSTGEPTKFPTFQEEQINNYANAYLARGWFGVSPLDEIFLFWGHSHLLGGGIKGYLNNIRRFIYDALINTKRLSAYDLSIDTLKANHKTLSKSNPVLIIGYTSTIFKLAKYIKENNLSIGNKSKLKGIVITSETVSKVDVDLIEEIFGVKCIIEYGMAETGVIAHSSKITRGMNFFWDSFIGIKGIDNILYLSTIHKKAFPLINYKTEDLIVTKNNLSITVVDSITGRSKDVLKVYSAGKIFQISGIFLIHALKSYKGIYEIQFAQKKDYKVKISFTSNKALDIIKVSNYFIKNLRFDFPKIHEGCFIFEQVKSLEKTISGKQRVFVPD